IPSPELPLGSIPPPAAAFAISSAGFAPNAAEDKKPKKAMTIRILATYSTRPRRRLEQKRCARSKQVKLTDGFSFRVLLSRRITFDMFIFAGVTFFVSRKLAAISPPAILRSSAAYREIHRPDKKTFLFNRVAPSDPGSSPESYSLPTSLR